MINSHDLLDPDMIDAAGGDSNEVLRRLAPSPDPVDQAMVVGWVKKRGLPGVVPMVATVLTGDEVDVVERSIQGVTLAECLDVIHQEMSTGVALSIIEDAARIVTSIHELDERRPSIHGQLSLSSFILTPESEIWLAGFNGFRGDPQIDIRGLVHCLGELLLRKAAQPGGADLLERLLTLQFDSMQGLAETINAHLKTQPFERRLVARAQCTARLFEAVGGPQRRPVPAREASVTGGIPVAGIGTPQTDPAELPFDPVPERELSAALSEAFRSESDPATIRVRSSYAGDSGQHTQATVLTQLDARALELLEEANGGAGPVAPSNSEDRPASSREDSARNGLMAPAVPREAQSTAAVLVGEYKVVAGIGKGGMGEIYLARSMEDDRLVALKVLGAAESGDEEALGMLMDEAAIMARIDHPHVLKVLDFGQAHGRYYLASEYLEGRPLVRIMIDSYDRDGGMDPMTVACIGAQSARGLHAAHTATTLLGDPLDVIHRDVSPQNIFITYRGEAKVIDFGVARATERFSKTQVGLVKGKAAYMSPEQAEGRPLDARSDVFSLGICLWEMIAGKRLFKRGADYETLMAVQTAPIEPPGEVRGRPDAALDGIVMRALRRDRAERTPSAEVLADQLEEYLAARGLRDGVRRLHRMMERLFHEESKRERALVRDLEARSVTEENAVSLRELSSVSEGSDNPAITIVADADALGMLERYGKERQPQPPPVRELTGMRVIRKVHEAAVERTSDIISHGALARAASSGVMRPVEPLPPTRRKGRSWHVLPLTIISGSLIGGAVGLLVTQWLNTPALGEGASAQIVMPIRRDDLVRGLRAVGAKVEPASGPIQTVQGISRVPFELDDTSRVRWLETEQLRGWLLEITPRNGGPGVMWIRKASEDASVHPLSVNDCPAQAHVDDRGLEIDYGSGFVSLELGVDQLNDVVLTAPEGADRLEIQPLGLAFGRREASSHLTHCSSGWRRKGRVMLRRMPFGEYALVWKGRRFEMRDQLKVGPQGIRGGLRVRGPFH